MIPLQLGGCSICSQQTNVVVTLTSVNYRNGKQI